MTYAILQGGPRDGDQVRLDREIGFRPECGYCDLEYMDVYRHGFVDPARLADRRARGLELRVVRYSVTDRRDDDGRVICVYEGECEPVSTRGRGDSAFIGDYDLWRQQQRAAYEQKAAQRQAEVERRTSAQREHLEQLPFTWIVQHAYHPRIGERYDPSADHLVVTETVDIGRLYRRPGDALCKPASKFWGLYTGGQEKVPSCKQCLERAERIIARGAR